MIDGATYLLQKMSPGFPVLTEIGYLLIRMGATPFETSQPPLSLVLCGNLDLC